MKMLFVGNFSLPGEHREYCLMQALKDLGVHVDALDVLKDGRRLRRPLAGQFALRAGKMPWEAYDVFHVPAAIVAASLAKYRRRGAKVVYDCRGLRYAEIAMRGLRGLGRLRVPVMRALERRAAKRCDLCITVSGPLRDWLADVRGGAAGLEIIRNGVDADLFAPAPGGRASDGFLVGYAGQFQNWQAVDLLIDAARLLADEPGLRWRIIGFRDADRDIKRRFAETLPAGAELIDRCDRETLSGLLGECDLLTIPRKPYLACQVAMPIKFAEYLALGKPVLVNTVDETQHIVRDVGCGFVAESDPRAMADAIRRAARTPPEQIRAMGQAGRDHATANLTWDVIGPRYKAFLEANL